jgi:hypothetical protein
VAATVPSSVRLVLSVARLGEADLTGWWNSRGFGDVGEYLLTDLFPRTWAVAGAELAVLSAAKRHHDALPDRDDVVHLFGEPFPAFAHALEWLAELKTGGDAAFLEELRSWSSEADAATAIGGAGNLVDPGERIGATLRLGVLPAAALREPEQVEATARSLATAYVGQGADLAIPYFDLR